MPKTTANQTINSPAQTLADEPSVTSEAELSLAMHELCWLHSNEAAERAMCNAQIATIKEQSEARLRTKSGVSFADRVKRLTDAAVSFCREARDVLLTGKGKTVKQTHGEIKFQEQKARLEVVAQKKLDTIIEQLEQSLTASLARQRIGDDGETAKATALFDVRVTLNKSRGYDSCKSEDVSKSILKQLGLKVAKPDERVVIKPFAYTVEPASDVS